ncbi:MAG: hypothetical protein CVV42_06620 [Candidatus Riflebacteria bacterium HGW-Riflebacteria-2]|jgi:hypothetical protein|nr:MAG: hypothetical protein CVV42_06620 [Candidatus Riflebacteria bacterium HGW-Riflebacteria-2]
MKYQHTLCVLLILLLSTTILPAERLRKWEFINPADLQVTITPEKSELISGTIATFTITIRNRTNHTINVHYPTGQQWDLAAYHGHTQIYRWSQGYTWADAPHTIPLKRGETRSQQLTWLTVDRNGEALPHSIYKIHGMAMLSPRHLVSNDCIIRLLPPAIKPQQLIETRLNQMFDIELPRYSGTYELDWQIDYVYNDNRISVHSVNRSADKVIVTFHPKRVGHVEFHLFAYHDTQDATRSLERRSFRVEVR